MPGVKVDETGAGSDARALHLGGRGEIRGGREEPWPRALSRQPITSFAFAERYGEPR